MAANPYTAVAISGYNSAPPPDDGSQSASNKLEWAKHKTKLTDPLIKSMRRILPNMGPVDFGPIAALFVVWLVRILANGMFREIAAGSGS